MLKKLSFVAVAVLMVVSISVPTLAQVDTTQQNAAAAPTTTDTTTSGWGDEAWFINQFGVDGDISGICNTIGQNSATEANWTAQYPDLPQWCGWDQQGTTQQAPTQQGSTQQAPAQQVPAQQAPTQQGTAQYAQYAQ